MNYMVKREGLVRVKNADNIMVGMWCSRASCWSSLSWHAVKMFCLLDKTDHVTGVTSQMGFLLNFRFQLCFSLTLGQIYFCQRISPIIYDIQQPWKKKAFLTNVQLKWDWRGKKNGRVSVRVINVSQEGERWWIQWRQEILLFFE